MTVDIMPAIGTAPPLFDIAGICASARRRWDDLHPAGMDPSARQPQAAAGEDRLPGGGRA